MDSNSNFDGFLRDGVMNRPRLPEHSQRDVAHLLRVGWKEFWDSSHRHVAVSNCLDFIDLKLMISWTEWLNCVTTKVCVFATLWRGGNTFLFDPIQSRNRLKVSRWQTMKRGSGDLTSKNRELDDPWSFWRQNSGQGRELLRNFGSGSDLG